MSALIIAHRGESYDAPENTLASINLAWERGAEAVEIDVHLSKDNQVVVIHDPNTLRVSGIKKKIKNSTVADLKKLDVGSWKSAEFKNEKIPTLKEVLATVPQSKKLIIEIKSELKILNFLRNDIENSGLTSDQIEIISFDFSTVKEAKKIFPKNKILYLADLDYTWYTKLLSPSVEKLIQMCKHANLEGLNVWAGNLLTKTFVYKVRNSNLLLYTWTVDDSENAKTLQCWGIDGITTNRANWLKNKIR